MHMPLKTYELTGAASDRVAVAIAKSRDDVERLAKRWSPGRNWTSIEEVRWREDYHPKFFGGRRPTEESYCEMNHPG
jgi:hypothetical protein